MTIEQRVAKLERQNRWMKRGGGLALAAFACVVLMGQGKPKELPDLDVRSLTVRGAGKSRVTFGQTEGKPYLALHDKRGETRVLLTLLTADGMPVLDFRDRMGENRARLGLLVDGSPGFKMYDAKRKVIWKVVPK